MQMPPASSDPVVSNTTPLIALAGVGLLDLLPSLYGDIWIPQAVFREYDLGRATHPGSPDLAQVPWIVVHQVRLHPSVPPALDPGEREALSLALAQPVRLVLIDELRARRVAAQLGLPLTGSLAVLLEAKQHGLLTAIAPIIDQMIAQGRRISPTLRRHVLDLANE